MFKLYSKDGAEAVVKTMADRKEYLASGFYSEKPFSVDGEREEDKGVVKEVVDIEDAEFVEVIEDEEGEDESESEVEMTEEEARELYLEKFGKKAGNMSFANIKAKLAE